MIEAIITFDNKTSEAKHFEDWAELSAYLIPVWDQTTSVVARPVKEKIRNESV